MVEDVSRYLDLFVVDAREHVGAMETSLARLESRDGEISGDEAREALDECFRRLHSLKSSAAIMGFEPISQLAHRMEDVVERLRGTNRIPQPILEVLIDSTSSLNGLVASSAKGKHADLVLPDALVSRIEAACETLTPEDESDDSEWAPGGAWSLDSLWQGPTVPTPSGTARSDESAERDAALPSRKKQRTPAADDPHVDAPDPRVDAPNPHVDAPPNGPHTLIRVRISDRAAAPLARAFLAIKRLESLGGVRSTEPPFASLKSGKCSPTTLTSSGLLVQLDGIHAAGKVREVLTRLPEIEDVEVVGDRSVMTQEPVPPPLPPPVDTATLKPTEQAIKVRVELLDELLELAGELVLASSRVHDTARLLPKPTGERLEEHTDRLRLLVKELNHRVLAARQSPLQLMVDRLPMVIRELSRRLDRKVSLHVDGADVTLDRGLIDALAEPLHHAVRNAVDHGIEPPAERLTAGKKEEGRLSFSARRERDKVLLELTDDGRGFDANRLRDKAVRAGALSREQADALTDSEALRLAFLPGLSTRDKSNEISGRGVGMDAVLQVTEQLGGTVTLESVPGQGSTVRFALPTTVSVVNLLLMRLGDEVLGLPVGRVVVATEGPGELQGRRSLEVNGQEIPAWDLGKLVGWPVHSGAGPRPWVVVDADGHRAALGVDELLGQEEVVLRPLGMPLDRIRGLAGTAILGSGRPIFVLDVPRLVG